MANLQDAFYRSQQTKFQEVEPNRILPDAIKGSLGDMVFKSAMDALSVFDPYVGKTVKPFTEDGLKGIFQGTPKDVGELERCRNYTGLKGLEQLIRDTQNNPGEPVRCGWRYKKSPGGLCPEVSQGALGTRTGPLDSTSDIDKLGNGVVWIWDLKQAEKTILTDAAREIKTGEALAVAQTVCNGDFRGKLGFCQNTNKVIPILSNGRPMYPTDPMLICPPANLITDPTKVPPPSLNNAAANFQQVAMRELSDCADNKINPSLSRDCLLQAIKNNGCSPNGTLYTALQAANPNGEKWDTQLKSQASFQAYQSRQGNNRFTERLFEKGMADWNTAIREVSRLQNAAQTASDSYTRISAQDLCTSRGSFDVFDFCAEISESAAIGTVDLKCLQRFWQQENGKPAGAAYPTSTRLSSVLGTINTYGDYKAAVRRLKSMTESTDPVAQRRAADNFYGVRVSSNTFNVSNPDEQSGSPLQFWIDVMDAATITIDGKNGVSRINDKSGKGRNLVQNTIDVRPVYTRSGTYGGIEFNGMNQFIDIPNAYNLVRNQFTIFVVERRKSGKSTNYMFGGTSTQGNGNLHLGYRSDSIGTMAFFHNDVDTSLPIFRGTTEPTRLWCYKKPAGRKEITIDGGIPVANNPRTDSLVNWSGAAIGRYFNSFYQGVIYEILIYDRALSLDAQRRVEGYLAHKWAMAASLPVNHPFKASPP
jgi:hypothetical protein